MDYAKMKCVLCWEGRISHLEVNTEVPAHGLGGCNASHRNTKMNQKYADPHITRNIKTE
jgi:hypothetical protein